MAQTAATLAAVTLAAATQAAVLRVPRAVIMRRDARVGRVAPSRGAATRRDPAFWAPRDSTDPGEMQATHDTSR